MSDRVGLLTVTSWCVNSLQIWEFLKPPRVACCCCFCCGFRCCCCFCCGFCCCCCCSTLPDISVFWHYKTSLLLLLFGICNRPMTVSLRTHQHYKCLFLLSETPEWLLSSEVMFEQKPPEGDILTWICDCNHVINTERSWKTFLSLLLTTTGT